MYSTTLSRILTVFSFYFSRNALLIELYLSGLTEVSMCGASTVGGIIGSCFCSDSDSGTDTDTDCFAIVGETGWGAGVGSGTSTFTFIIGDSTVMSFTTLF